MDKQSNNHLSRLVEAIESVALKYKAAKYAMLEQKADGFACMISKEARERWCLAAKIRKYIIIHDGKTGQIGAKSAVIVSPSSVSDCLKSLVEADVALLSNVDTATQGIMVAGHVKEAVFLAGISESLQAECNEVATHLDHAKDNADIVSMNSTLREQYGNEG